MCNHFCSLFLRWDKIKRISNASVRSHRKAENHTTSLRLSIINRIHRTRFPFPVWEGEYFASLGGADIFLDHSGSTYIIPKLSLYSTGLMPPKVILIRSSLYQ